MFLFKGNKLVCGHLQAPCPLAQLWVAVQQGLNMTLTTMKN